MERIGNIVQHEVPLLSSEHLSDLTGVHEFDLSLQLDNSRRKDMSGRFRAYRVSFVSEVGRFDLLIREGKIYILESLLKTTLARKPKKIVNSCFEAFVEGNYIVLSTKKLIQHMIVAGFEPDRKETNESIYNGEEFDKLTNPKVLAFAIAIFTAAATGVCAGVGNNSTESQPSQNQPVEAVEK